MKRIKHTSHEDDNGMVFHYLPIEINIGVGYIRDWSFDDGPLKLAYDYEIMLGDERWGGPDEGDLMMAIGVLEQIKKYLQKELCEMEKRRNKK